MKIPQTKRIKWIDCMKVRGITFIVYGHFFSIASDYIYTFNVPLFFIISGFLSKSNESHKLFWKKTLYNLIIPLLLISSLNYILNTVELYYNDLTSFIDSPLTFIMKMSSGILLGGVGSLWFVYTLILLKIISHYIHKQVILLVLLTISFSCAYIINNNDPILYGRHIFHIPCAITNIFVAYPFYLVGIYTKKSRIIRDKKNFNKWDALIILVSCVIITIEGNISKPIYMYQCGYGNSIVLFFLCGIAGTILIFYISKYLERTSCTLIQTISTGTILILGFHLHLVQFITKCIPNRTLMDVTFSFIIVLLFVPVIQKCEIHFPYILGKLRIEKK